MPIFPSPTFPLLFQTAAALAIMLSAATARAETDCRLKLIASAPATLEPPAEILLAVSMDGLPTKMLLDTGASTSFIDPTIVGVLKLPIKGTTALGVGIGGAFSMATARVAELKVGSAVSRDQDFVIKPFHKDEPIAPYSGIFAADYLSNYDVELDLGEGKVNLFSHDHCQGKVVYWDNSFYETPIRVDRQNHIMLDVDINGATVSGGLDTGASMTFLKASTAEQLLGKDALAADPVTTSGGLGGPTAARLHRFSTVAFGGIKLNNWAVSIWEDRAKPGASTSPPAMAPMSHIRLQTKQATADLPDTIIGMDVIRNFRMFIAYSDSKIYFTPLAAPIAAVKPAPQQPASSAPQQEPAVDDSGKTPEEERNVGLMYQTGRGTPIDYGQALKWYTLAAGHGDAAAMNQLGQMNEKGLGSPTNYSEAMKWYMKAADAGNAPAENNIGLLYFHGKGVEKDGAAALAWFRKAADQGSAVGEFDVGSSYETGSGVSIDLDQAMTWYRKAADHGYAAAKARIGSFYAAGKSIAKDCAEAHRWLQDAAAAGDQGAKSQLKANKDCSW
ncbi:MAG TPA: aspartyl protease family protein [Stellaceae bacterium]|nr:aspartyl protease family protein [Stellaceae bacterium]